MHVKNTSVYRLSSHTARFVATALMIVGCEGDPFEESAAGGDFPFGTEDIVIAPDRAAQIWETEQFALLLASDVQPIWRRALQESNGEAIAGHLAADFAGHVFLGPGEQTVHGVVQLDSWRRTDIEGPWSWFPETPVSSVTPRAFVAWLIEMGRGFADVPSFRFHVTALEPGPTEETWRSTWEIEILGTLSEGGRSHRSVEMELILAKSTDDPAAQSGWIRECVASRAWRVRSPGPLMEEITTDTGIDTNRLGDNWKNAGPPYPEFRGSASLLDVDQDGALDLLVDSDHSLDLYRGLGNGRFEDITASSQLKLPEFSRVRAATVADLDNDGFEDVLADVAVKSQGVRTLAFRNLGDRSFRPLTDEEHNLHGYDLRSAAVADHDLDGLVDLYLPFAGGRSKDSDVEGRRWLGDRSGSEGVLLRNLGDWQFEDITEATATSGGFTPKFGAIWTDMEPDGDPDLFFSNHMGQNILLENLGADGFRPRDQPGGFGGFSMGATAGDLDGDGDPDLYVANMYTASGARIVGNLRPSDYPPGAYELIHGFVTGNELYVNGPEDDLRPVGAEAGVANANWSYGPMVVDLDGDGRLDLYAPSGHQSVARGEPDG